ncbi:endonuclease domain-containing protein [Candidatus Dojkabacteria bacterium]|nr:endonuclease domain-containing protein [Candidatus Dojkabacteria bacterium]
MNRSIYNNKKLKQFRRSLRRNQTTPESYLWSILRNSQLGYKFKRQFSIGNFILDFYCPQLRVGIELDGCQHLTNKRYDDDRTKFLNNLDIEVIRFWNNEVYENITGVIEKIEEILVTTSSKSSPKLGEEVTHIKS